MEFGQWGRGDLFPFAGEEAPVTSSSRSRDPDSVDWTFPGPWLELPEDLARRATKCLGDATEPLELEIWPERQGEVPRGPSAVETALEGRHFQVKAWGEQMYGTLVDLPCFVESHILPPQNASQALYKSANVEQMLIVHREEELPDTDRLERKTFRWRSGLTPATANVVERWKGVPPSNSIFAPPLIREATKALKSRLDRSDFTYEEEAEVDEAFCAKIRQEEPQNVWVPPEGLRAPMRDPPAASAPSSGHGTGTAASQPPSQLEGSASEVSLQSGVKASGALSTGATPKPGLRLKLGGRDKMDRTHVFPCDRHRLQEPKGSGCFGSGDAAEGSEWATPPPSAVVRCENGALRTRIQVLSRETSATQAGKPVPSIASGCFVGPINPMGCALSSPVELIRVQRQGSSAFRCAVAEMQGWRVGHEDAHAMRCEGSSATCLVFDGHGGDGAALFAAPELCEDLYKGEKAPDVPSDAHIEGSFAHVDQKLRGYFQEHAEKDSGTTVVGAVCARTKDNSYTVKLLNCGDSRAVIVRNPKDEESNSVSIRRPSHIEALACLGAGGTGNPAKGIDGRPIEDDSSPSGKPGRRAGKTEEEMSQIHKDIPNSLGSAFDTFLVRPAWDLKQETANTCNRRLTGGEQRRTHPYLSKLPSEWFESRNGRDPFPNASEGPIYKPKGRAKVREKLDKLTDEVVEPLCKGLPGSRDSMKQYTRGSLKLSDLSELMKHYDQLAGYDPDNREVPQDTLFCGPVEEETWRMRRKLKTGMYTHRISANYSCNESQFSSHAQARFYLQPCDETAPTREEAPFVPRKLNKLGIMLTGPVGRFKWSFPGPVGQRVRQGRLIPRSLVVVETIDHKPDHPTEKQRIETAGGTVSFEDPPRLDGSLAVSRGLGDFEYKADGKRTVGEQKVSCIPDIYEVSSLAPGTLCILGCDGIWDVMTAEQVAQLVCEALATDLDLGDIAAEILRQCLQRNSRDNMTCMIMHFADGSDWANFPDEMKNYDKLANGDHDEDVQSHYASFLSTAKFPAQAVACDVCQRWLVQMQQCTCKQTFYCSRHCQKKGWKVHSAVCPTKLDGAKRESAAA
ncbi:unnamed protein product [Durusdinium trenchii]|uniref:Uncharacterized protein n=1 Tax=Durusdinium trenchii TaxID=1381693 RepID=A0ABP0IGW6_9DINO